MVFDWHKCSSIHKGDYLFHLSSIDSKLRWNKLYVLFGQFGKNGNKAKPARDLGSFTTTYLHTFCAAKIKYHLEVNATPQLSPPTVVHVLWKPLALSDLEMNVDANKKIIGVGVVVRDTYVQVVVALSKLIIANFASHGGQSALSQFELGPSVAIAYNTSGDRCIDDPLCCESSL
ncbi:hypothetical protein CsatB_005481 [Cannabis sativa]